jgi:hypothetical protein
METTAELADVRWDDSRRFAFELFHDALADAPWTPALLVSLCDSVRRDVRQFGRELIARRFHEPDGPEYALKLSEHPDLSVQAFASAFLDHIRIGDPEAVRRLAFYCTSINDRWTIVGETRGDLRSARGRSQETRAHFPSMEA